VGVWIALVLWGRVAGADESWVVAFAHVAEVVGGCVDAPEFVACFAAGDEDAVLVPAVDPSDAVVEAEEAGLDPLAALVLDVRRLLAALVVVVQQIAT
jgi:hypothetical protein